MEDNTTGFKTAISLGFMNREALFKYLYAAFLALSRLRPATHTTHYDPPHVAQEISG